MIVAKKKIQLELEIEMNVREPIITTESNNHSITKTLQDYSWKEIYDLKDKANEIFKIGDEKVIKLKNGEEVTLAICDFKRDYDPNRNVLPITFTTKNLLQDYKFMNKTDTNKSGYKGCAMIKSLQEVFELLPDDLQEIISITDKDTCEDKLFLFSEIEVFDKTFYSDDEFGSQYEYYKDKQHRCKFRNEDMYSSGWWLRSPDASNSTYFCIVNSSGDADLSNANYSWGVAFGFCI